MSPPRKRGSDLFSKSLGSRFRGNDARQLFHTWLALARHAQELFARCDAGGDPALAVLGERAEAARARELGEPLLALALMDRRAHRLVDLQELVDAGAAVVAGVQTFRAAGAVAVGAELAKQPLCEDAQQ